MLSFVVVVLDVYNFTLALFSFQIIYCDSVKNLFEEIVLTCFEYQLTCV